MTESRRLRALLKRCRPFVTVYGYIDSGSDRMMAEQDGILAEIRALPDDGDLLPFVYPYKTSAPCGVAGCGVREDGGPPPYCSELCWLRSTYSYQQGERDDDARTIDDARAECERLAEREPTGGEMERFLAGRDELPEGEPYPKGWPTIRRCRHCRLPVAGGPTACRLSLDGPAPCTACLVAAALIESRRQVEALTKERDEARRIHAVDFAELCAKATALVDESEAGRLAATARAERAEAELAGQCETCEGEGIMYTGKEVYLGSGALTPDEEAVNCPECLGSTRGWVAQAIAGKVARVVEAIAAWHDKASNIDSSHGNSGQAFTHALSADHIRSHNWLVTT